jgi:SAM-dependent methyltransferase
MGDRAIDGMRRYWDERAQANAAWYVDTSLAYDSPDMTQFFLAAEVIVAAALDDAPARPAGRDRAVEIGSGLGRICLALAGRFDEVIGVDIAPEMVRRARELVEHPHVEFVLGDGSSLQPIADSSADLVLSFTVFQHIPKVRVIDDYIAEASRVLKPGGLLIFQWSNLPGHRTWPLRRFLLGVLQRTGLHPERYRRNAPQFLGSRVPSSRIRHSVESAGLDLVGLRDEGSLFAWAWATRR